MMNQSPNEFFCKNSSSVEGMRGVNYNEKLTVALSRNLSYFYVVCTLDDMWKTYKLKYEVTYLIMMRRNLTITFLRRMRTPPTFLLTWTTAAAARRRRLLDAANNVPFFSLKNFCESLVQCIFSFITTRKSKEYIELRCLSKFVSRSLPPPPLWTSFPHSNYATLQGLLDYLQYLRYVAMTIIPSLLFIDEGKYVAENTYVKVRVPLTICGAGRGKTNLLFGLEIKRNKSEGIVEIKDLTIKGGKEHGLSAWKGMNVKLRGCSIEHCGWHEMYGGHGVFALNADILCDDLQVTGCGHSGVYASKNATITLRGQGTSIQGNVTKGCVYEYGLKASDYRRPCIQLVYPLNKEDISKDNSGGNWGGGGIIKQVDRVQAFEEIEGEIQ